MKNLYAVLFISICSSATNILSMETHRERQEREMFNPRAAAPVYGQPLSHRDRQERAMQQHQATVQPKPTVPAPAKK